MLWIFEAKIGCGAPILPAFIPQNSACHHNPAMVQSPKLSKREMECISYEQNNQQFDYL